jgi:hypothetical protein
MECNATVHVQPALHFLCRAKAVPCLRRLLPTQAVDICASRQRLHSRCSLAPRGVAGLENSSRPCSFLASHVIQPSKVALGDTGRVISTAGAAAEGTARGFSILSRITEPLSSSFVKNSFLSKSTVHSSMDSMV